MIVNNMLRSFQPYKFFIILSDFVYSEEIVVENNPNSSNSVDLPFNREEFIVIPFLLCILILMIFLRGCFPMKGGKSI